MADMRAEQKVIVPLEYPLPVKSEGGGTVMVHQLELGRIKACHLQLFPQRFFEDGNIIGGEWLPIIRGLSDMSEETIDAMDMKDVLKVVEVIRENFL